jgi:hypothetical protein
MRKKFVVAGVLTGGIALTGLAGSAHAEGGAAAASPAAPVGKGHGRIAVICLAKKKPTKGVVSTMKPVVAGKPMIKLKGGDKAFPAPPFAAKDAAKILAKKKALGTVRIWTENKMTHCAVVKPGMPAR